MATRDQHKGSGASRNRRHHSHNQHHNYYKYLVGLCAVVFSAPAYAEGTSVAANPQASINGSVANQAVQINQGSLSTQSFRSGNYCNGPILSFTPYYLVTESMASSFSTSKNFGGQVSFSVPLDGGAVELCKEVARKELEKTRLDYELVRIKECIGIFQKGFMIRPGTPFYQVCADVVPIASLVRKKEAAVSSEQQPTSSEGS